MRPGRLGIQPLQRHNVRAADTRGVELDVSCEVNENLPYTNKSSRPLMRNLSHGGYGQRGANYYLLGTEITM